ncbi:amino acid ABC transporter substrate-binding protein [Oxalicibacterium flavum]|uniref:Amino acid ABC transporter substrate-binding protein n=1 Tax=Oxalicibacterium flavum TaxID=179467 RepID=A0A8J2UJV9_9BURK|nr:TonB-dependent receptor [Oxalicibacterium flavum]GGC02876.1 amino acid ABC transporter substrate-binding protein [Oxalicibacterium flavum]
MTCRTLPNRHTPHVPASRPTASVFALKPLALAIHLMAFGSLLAAAGWSADAQAQIAAPPSANTAQARHYDIPAGALSTVLTRFSSETGIHLIGASSQAQGKNSPGLHGQHSVESGFAALLAGTGLEAFRQADGSYGIRPQGDAQVSAQPAGEALPAVTVTGNWLNNPNERRVLEHPGARSILERERIHESGAASVREALRQVAGVQAQENNGTSDSDVALNVGVRGLTARMSPRSLIMLDGVPVSFAPYGQPQLSLAPVSLGNMESIDVVRGAGSVRYGPQNVGGIINFVTRAIPQDFAGSVSLDTEIYGHTDHIKYSPNLFLGGTNDKGLGGAILYSGTHGKGYRAANSTTDIDDIILKGSYRFSPQSDLAVSLHHFDGKGRMPGGLTTAEYANDPFQSTRPYDQFMGDRTDASAKYTYHDGINNFEVLAYYVDSFRGSYVEQEGADANAGRRRLTSAPRNYHYFGIEPRYSRLFETGSVIQEISIGYRYLKESSAEVAARTAYYDPAGGNAFDLAMLPYQTSKGGTTAHAFYIDDRIDFGKWTITPGVRFERISTYNDVATINTAGAVTDFIQPSIDARETLPTISVQYRANEAWSLFANAGKSFGPQQYNQLTSTTNGLHPESAKTYEIGTHFNNQSLQGELTLFHIDFDKELQLERTITGEGQWTDLGATLHRGLESAVRYDLGDWDKALRGLSLYATYTYTQAISRAGNFEGRDLPLYSRHVAQFGTRYEIDRWTFNADVHMQSKQRSPGSGATYVTQENAAGRLGDIPGYATLGLRAGYDFGKQMDNLKLSVGVKNVFDRRYFTRSTDNNGGKFVGMPRTIYLQASVGF